MTRKQVTLDEFIKENNIKAYALADLLKRTPGYISKLRKFKLMPPLDIVLAIKRISKNKVPPKMLFKDEEIQKLFK